MKHVMTVPKYSGTLKELAVDISNMRYDAVADFLGHLSDAIFLQVRQDAARSRAILADTLLDTYASLRAATMSMRSVWRICEPFMKK